MSNSQPDEPVQQPGHEPGGRQFNDLLLNAGDQISHADLAAIAHQRWEQSEPQWRAADARTSDVDGMAEPRKAERHLTRMGNSMLLEGWRESTLGQIGTIKSGGTPSVPSTIGSFWGGIGHG